MKRQSLKTIFALAVFLPFICVSFTYAAGSQSKLSEGELEKFAQNDILFYDPSDCISTGGKFSSICGSTPREKYWSALRQELDEVHAAAILGSVDHEGSGGVARWEIGVIVTGDGGTFIQPWEKLINKDLCDGGPKNGYSVCGGVGSFGISWTLASYLNHVNEENPDLLKYFQDPTNYSFPGDETLDRIGDTDYDRLVEQEVKYVLNEADMESFKATSSLDEATDWWTMNYENCVDCCGGADYDKSCEQISIRRASAQKEYDELKDFNCKASSSNSPKVSSANTNDSNKVTNASSSDSSIVTSSNTEIQWDNGWLVEGSLEGVTIENMNDRANELNEVPSGIGTYETEDGKPNKILLHSTEEIGRDGIKIYPSGNVYPAHFVVNLKDKKVWQHFSIYQPSTAIAKHDKSGPIQFEIIGFSTPSSNGYQSEWDLDNFSDEDWDYLAKILLAVSRETGIPLTSSVSWGSDAKRMGAEEFLEYEGVLGHMHVPDNDHTDPGNIWQYVEDAIERQSGDCGTGEFVWYGQFVEPWASIKYTVDGVTSTVGDDGCGPTAFAMLANMLLGEEITPEDTIKIAADTHSIIPFAGSIGSVLTENLAEHYGLQWEKLDNSSIEASMNDITQHLKDGWMVMTAGAGSVPYTPGGHYVGIRGIDSNGKWLLADSGHTEDVSQQPWEPKDVMTAGINPDNVYAIKTSSSTPCRDNGNICKDSNSGAGTEATKPIGPIHDPSDDIACDPRTKDLGIRDDAYYNYEKYSIRLCSIPNIKMNGAQGDDGDDGYVHVNSRVSGAFYSLSEEHHKRCGNYLEAVDDYRTNAEQTALYNAYLSGTGNLAAVPGSPFSNHQGGLAIDFDTSTYCSSDSSVASGPGGWFESDFLSQFGLEDGRNFSQPENWHVQAAEQ